MFLPSYHSGRRPTTLLDFLIPRRIAGLVDAFETEWLADPDGLVRYDKLLAMADRESKVIASLATKMRLTPQSRYQPNTAARQVACHQPADRLQPWQKHVMSDNDPQWNFIA